MARHASWKGHLKISLAAIPVQAFTAAAGDDSSEISFNQLHKPCKNRIHYKKVCPIHGEVPMSEIVSGYEYAKGQYVIIDKDELSSMASDLEKSLTIECFVPPSSIAPEYCAGQSYFLIPDGRVGQKPYALICAALQRTQLHGVGELVISKKQRLVRMRAADNLIVIDVLHYAGEIRKPEEFKGDAPPQSMESAEVSLAKSLLEQMQQPQFDPSHFVDNYSARVRNLIDSKLKGNKLSVPQTAQPDLINFIDALQKSVKAIPVPEKLPLPRKKAEAKKTVPLKTTARRIPPAKPTRKRPHSRPN